MDLENDAHSQSDRDHLDDRKVLTQFEVETAYILMGILEHPSGQLHPGLEVAEIKLLM